MFSPWTDMDTHAVIMWVVFLVLLFTIAKLLSWTVFRRSLRVRPPRERFLKPAVKVDKALAWEKIEVNDGRG
jgi:hypothetical protein